MNYKFFIDFMIAEFLFKISYFLIIMKDFYSKYKILWNKSIF